MSAPSICVFCGARNGNKAAYVQAARDFGQIIAENHWRLVYGAGDVGLMGETARATMAAEGKAFGVIPTHLMSHERGKRDLSTFVITEDMHERKKVMFMNSDMVVVLPGGAGSLDEFFEVLTWAQIGLHKKPIFLLNIENYWQPLLTLIDHIISEEFAAASLRDLFKVMPDVASLKAAIKAEIA